MPIVRFPRLACSRLMQLKILADSIPVREVLGPLDREVDGIFYDSRRVQKNGLYVAVRGATFDGHKFTEQAIERGASAIVVERPESHSRATSIVVADSRVALADLAFTFYKKPALRLKMAGVTGTNGKTTTTFLLKHICENAGLRSGLIGTVRYEIGERVLPATRTTPESLDLQELLAQMAGAGCKAAMMEVSSHALAQERTRGLEWDVAVFTNLTQDHLDFHQTMENYFEAKARLFTGLKNQPNKKQASAVINLDDRYGEQLVERLGDDVPVVTYGMSARADFRASNYRAEFSGTSFQLDARGKIYLVRVPLIGRFNVLNAMAALAAANSLGISLREAVLSLAKSPQVPGRLETVPAKRQFQVFVDYAHTPDALLNVLKTLRELGPRRLIVVFGAGGDRDKQKRPLMGRVADQNADYSIITSDNPRKEDPLAIIAEVKKGFRSSNFETVPDRAEAITRAIALAQPRDIILIAGKGHETYQEFADHTIPFDDRQMALRALENRPLEFSHGPAFDSTKSRSSPGPFGKTGDGDALSLSAPTRAPPSRAIFSSPCGRKFRRPQIRRRRLPARRGRRDRGNEMERQTAPDFALLRVADTLVAYQQVAANYRRSLGLKVVAITGSNGKTSTKDFTASVLAHRFHVTKTEGNFNNHVGLPRTMLEATAQDQIGVWEIGMNHPGEIAPLAQLARPDVAIITNIGIAHLEFMGTREAIAQEKGELAAALPPRHPHSQPRRRIRRCHRATHFGQGHFRRHRARRSAGARNCADRGRGRVYHP